MSTVPRFGLNYVPSRNWWYAWVDWDAASIAEDLRTISGLGCDHIRIHCLWTLFQPNATLVSPAMLDRLAELMDLADEAGLDVVVTVLDGWLSGFDFRPAWLGDGEGSGHGADIFTDPMAIAAERRLISAIGERVAGHPRFLGFDVANEPSVLAVDGKNDATRDAADAWVTDLLAHCERVAPGKLHSVGMDHQPWLTDRKPFGRPTLGATGSVVPVHAWIYFTGALERYGELGTGTIRLAEYTLELAKAFADDPTKPVWLQEYGVAPDWLDRLAPEEFLELATRSAVSVDGVWGLTWWCSHDVSRELHGFAELEYDLGLITVDNVVKPTGERFRRMIELVRAGQVPVGGVRSIALVLPDERTPDLDFADAFFALSDAGVRPAIVLASRAVDPDYLAGRGVVELRHAADVLA